MSQQQKGILFGSILFLLFIFAVVMCNRNDDSDDFEIPSTQIESSEQNNNEEIVVDNQPQSITITNDDSLINSNDLSSQQSNLGQWSEIDLQRANTAVRNHNLSKEEKQIILYTNLARLNGAKFCELYVSPLANKDPNNSYIKSLVSDLNSIKDLPMLYPNDILFRAAEYHANDLGKTGKFQHESTDGTSFQKRISSFGYKNPAGENIFAGIEDPLHVVLDLLIDEGIPDVGHRKNILRKAFNSISVARRPHNSDCKFVVVMDFGQE